MEVKRRRSYALSVTDIVCRVGNLGLDWIGLDAGDEVLVEEIFKSNLHRPIANQVRTMGY